MAVLYVVLTWRCRQDEMAREAAAFETGQRAAGLPDKYFHLMVGPRPSHACPSPPRPRLPIPASSCAGAAAPPSPTPRPRRRC